MFYINFDVTPLLALGQELDAASKKAMKDAGERLTAMTRAHIIEEAGKRLHTRRQMYIDGISHFQVNEDTWVVNLDAKVRWIEDGMPEHNMLDDLLKSKSAKNAKDGSKYVVVPFEHGPKGETQMTPAQKTLLDTIKSTLKEKKIPYGKMETGAGGKPKTGLLHSFDIKNAPIKQTNAPGQGAGPVGSPMQGPTGIPLLQGVRVYQYPIPTSKLGKTEKSGFKRMIMTFRIASSNHKNEPGRWDHPGLPAVKLMDEAYEWAKQTWERDIVPGLALQLAQSF